MQLLKAARSYCLALCLLLPALGGVQLDSLAIQPEFRNVLTPPETPARNLSCERQQQQP